MPGCLGLPENKTIQTKITSPHFASESPVLLCLCKVMFCSRPPARGSSKAGWRTEADSFTRPREICLRGLGWAPPAWRLRGSILSRPQMATLDVRRQTDRESGSPSPSSRPPCLDVPSLSPLFSHLSGRGSSALPCGLLSLLLFLALFLEGFLSH